MTVTWVPLHRRPVVLIATVVVLAALVAGMFTWTTAPTDHGSPIDWVYSPHPERRYLTVGTNDGRQFSDAEYTQLARDYSVVVFTKFHAGWDVKLHHEATRRLKDINPDIKVFAYMSTKYWFNSNDWGVDIDPDWFLHDDEGNPIPRTQADYDPNSDQKGFYIDVSNPAYREWLLGVARSWFAAAPYDGIRFDAADHIGDYGEHNVAFWERRLSPARLRAYNEGIDELLRTLREELAPQQIFFNGIGPSAIRGEDRGLSTLAFTDGAMDELFCGAQGDVVADIEIMQRYPDKSLQMHMPGDPDDVDADVLRKRQRFCVGSFLVGWQPSSTHFSAGKGYSVDQLSEQPADIDLDLGAPLGAFRRDGDLLQRAFTHGMVYVNVGDEPAEFTLPGAFTRVENRRSYGSYEGQYTLDGNDGVFFLSDAFVAAG